MLFNIDTVGRPLSQQEFVNYFLVEILIRPLSVIEELLNQGAYAEALWRMKTYILSLPPSIKKELKAKLREIDEFFKEYGKIDGLNWVQIKDRRNKFENNEGRHLAIEIWNTLWNYIYSQQLFNEIKRYPLFDMARGRVSGDKPPAHLPERLPDKMVKGNA